VVTRALEVARRDEDATATERAEIEVTAALALDAVLATDAEEEEVMAFASIAKSDTEYTSLRRPVISHDTLN
jgi:hypothetical protein